MGVRLVVRNTEEDVRPRALRLCTSAPSDCSTDRGIAQKLSARGSLGRAWHGAAIIALSFRDSAVIGFRMSRQ